MESLSDRLRRVIDGLKEDGYKRENFVLDELETCRAIAEHIEVVMTRGRGWL